MTANALNVVDRSNKENLSDASVDRENDVKIRDEKDDEANDFNKYDEQLTIVTPVAFLEPRHGENIVGTPIPMDERENWRIKERMKTVSVALVLCLNLGVDPPDVVKVRFM